MYNNNNPTYNSNNHTYNSNGHTYNSNNPAYNTVVILIIAKKHTKLKFQKKNTTHTKLIVYIFRNNVWMILKKATHKNKNTCAFTEQRL